MPFLFVAQARGGSGSGSGTSRGDGTRSGGSSSGSSQCASNRRNCVNYHAEADEQLNRQVNTELSASYAYTAMVSEKKW